MQRVRVTLSLLMAFATLSAIGAQTLAAAPLALDMEVRVPLILRVSVGGSWNTVLRLSGSVGDTKRGGHSFPIAPFAVTDLGRVRIFSNCESGYAISILSGGGGFLGSEEAGDKIPYSLILNGTRLQPTQGVFTYDMAGKSAAGGTSLDLQLALGDLADTPPRGLYDDKLTFSVAAR